MAYNLVEGAQNTFGVVSNFLTNIARGTIGTNADKKTKIQYLCLFVELSAFASVLAALYISVNALVIGNAGLSTFIIALFLIKLGYELYIASKQVIKVMGQYDILTARGEEMLLNAALKDTLFLRCFNSFINYCIKELI